jgi:eukaryotic-like serine/threonine-protein kinase
MSTAPEPLGAIAHYNLLDRLDPAGPGDLFRARDTHYGRTVTIRLLPASLTADGDARGRLIEQARTLIALSHPNVTTLFDAGEHQGRVYLAFEFLRGQSLRAEMAGGAMNVRRAVEIAVQIADAVAEAHAAGFVHGGLSPDSIVITAKGHAKIPAFELAAAAGFDDSGGDVRLHDYGSPEENRGEAPDDRSDIYSVGAVLYEMLTTRRPSHRGAAAPSATNPRVGAELDDVVLRAVAPNPNNRFASAATLAAELRAVAAILDVRGVPGEDEGGGGQVVAASATARRLFAFAAVILGAIAALAWWFSRS